MMSAESITVLDEYLVYNRKRSAKDSITDTRYQHIDCAYTVLSELKDYLMKTRQYESLKRDFAYYAIHLLNHTYPAKENDNIKKDEIRKKI